MHSVKRLTIAQVSDHIRPRLSGYLPHLSLGAPPSAFRVTRRSNHLRWRFLSLRSNYNETFEIILQTAGKPSLSRSLFLKVHENSHDALEEFRRLLLVSKHFRSSDEFKISPPLDVIKELGAVVTVGVDGVCLGNLIRFSRITSLSRKRIRSLTDHVERAGNWISSFHSMKIDESSLVNRHEVERELESLMKEALRLGFPERLAVRAYSKLEKIRGLSHRPVLLHGDFTPEHVFLNQKSVSVTDFELIRLGNEAWDLARFISYFDMMLAQLNVRRFSHLLKNVFLQTASRATSDRDELVNAFSLMIMLNKWVDAMRKLESRRTLGSYVFLPLFARKALRNVQCLCENRPV